MSSSTSSTRFLSASPDSPYILPQNTRFSRALMSGYRAMSCGTTPMVSLTACESLDDRVARRRWRRRRWA